MLPQAKILRIFKFIDILKKRKRTVKQLAEIMEVDARSIYRYIKLLEEIGFIIENNFDNHYFIADYSERSEGIEFSQEEAELVHQLVDTGANKHPLKDTIIKKLYVHSDIKHISDDIINARSGLLIRKLTLAIEHENQVVLEKYHSAHSNEIGDRLIEPVAFSNDYDRLFAFDVSAKAMKNYSVSRIGGVGELDMSMKFQSEHEQLDTDIFGMSGTPSLTVKMILSFRSYLLLIKEYPLSRMSIVANNNEEKTYLLDCKVSTYDGIGRFVLGLIDEIEVKETDEFKQHLSTLIGLKNF